MVDDIDREQKIEEAILKWDAIGGPPANIKPAMDRRMTPHSFGRLDAPTSTAGAINECMDVVRSATADLQNP
jgi:hypothetical protein